MTAIRLRYIQRYKDRHGELRHYFRRPGYKLVRLPGKPGSPEFMSAYNAALSDAPKLPPIGSGRTMPGSLDALALEWYGSAAFRQLASTTQAVYRRNLERIRAEHGHRLVEDLTPQAVRKLLAAKVNTPAAANHILRMLRMLMRHAIDAEWRPDDPTFGVRRLKERGQGRPHGPRPISLPSRRIGRSAPAPASRWPSCSTPASVAATWCGWGASICAAERPSSSSSRRPGLNS
ncbi:hypothetical protein [Teichococcus aestuarii]|uniref:hypothetical protein n=1 Tax=Teichococcus aestuarii TaxID=568898 RepID=UPI00361DA7E1